MGALDSDIHKLLGSEYKRYRSVQHAQKAKKASAEIAAAERTAAEEPDEQVKPEDRNEEMRDARKSEYPAEEKNPRGQTRDNFRDETRVELIRS